MPVQAVQGVQIALLIGPLHLHENGLRRRLIRLRHPVGMTAHHRFPVQPLQFLPLSGIQRGRSGRLLKCLPVALKFRLIRLGFGLCGLIGLCLLYTSRCV